MTDRDDTHATSAGCQGGERSRQRPSSAGDSHEFDPSAPSIGRLLLSAFEIFEDEIVEGIRRRGFCDFSLTDSYPLRNLRAEGSRISLMADRARVTKQTMSELVADLEARGYVQRHPDPDDGRAKRVKLTERGREVIGAARAAHLELLERWTDILGADDLEVLRSLLTRLLESYDRFPLFVDHLER